jgi:starvation-inducible DNA-binding protein
MNPTKNNLAEASRVKLAALLNARLADAIDLALSAKQAHWNVKGPQFIALHELFDKLRDEADEYVDDLAERVVQLGGTAEGTSRVVAARTTLAEYPLKITDGAAHLGELVAAYAKLGAAVRANIDEAAELRDADTADLFTEISRGIDKSLWFLEAHLQK